MWYQRLGLAPTGDVGPLSGPGPAQMLGLPEVELNISWLVGRDPMSQIELMQFSLPGPRPLPADWNLRYAGYGIASFVAPDFEASLHELRAAGTSHELTGPPGSRSLWIRDPDHIPVEILERDPLGSLLAAQDSAGLASIRAMSLTVDDLEKAKRYWTSAVGLTVCAPEQYACNAFPESLNGGVSHWEQVLMKGKSFLIRLLKPRGCGTIAHNPRRQLNDIGVLNLAAFQDAATPFAAVLERFRAMGYPLLGEAPTVANDDAAAIYAYDDQENSIELGFMTPGIERNYGWRR